MSLIILEENQQYFPVKFFFHLNYTYGGNYVIQAITRIFLLEWYLAVTRRIQSYISEKISIYASIYAK